MPFLSVSPTFLSEKFSDRVYEKQIVGFSTLYKYGLLNVTRCIRYFLRCKQKIKTCLYFYCAMPFRVKISSFDHLWVTIKVNIQVVCCYLL